jgi:hypothetical protein
MQERTRNFHLFMLAGRNYDQWHLCQESQIGLGHSSCWYVAITAEYLPLFISDLLPYTLPRDLICIYKYIDYFKSKQTNVMSYIYILKATVLVLYIFDTSL